MSELEIATRWEAERPIFQVWAEFVRDELCKRLLPVIRPTPLEAFLRIPVQPRLKDSRSLIDKALFRNKPYANPYDEITDKAGIRFVLLLGKDIRSVEQVIIDCDMWDASKDRDYESEREKKPWHFAYQAVHYVVRNRSALQCGGITVPTGTPCEIQVKTLLQHAHSELTHEAVYKNQTLASPTIQRIAAKSMALIEATDDFFEQVMQSLEKEKEFERRTIRILTEIYSECIETTSSIEGVNFIVLDALKPLITDTIGADVRALLNGKAFIVERIRLRAATHHIYSQPIIVLIYALVEQKPAATKDQWPLTSEDLGLVYSDLGKNLESY